MQSKSVITVHNLSRKSTEPRKNRVIPLRIHISVQDGKQYLIAYQPDFNSIKSFRVDYLSNVKIEGTTPRFDELRAMLDDMESKTWGVGCRGSLSREARLEHVEFTIKIEDGEEHLALAACNKITRELKLVKVYVDQTFKNVSANCEFYYTDEESMKNNIENSLRILGIVRTLYLSTRNEFLD